MLFSSEEYFPAQRWFGCIPNLIFHWIYIVPPIQYLSWQLLTAWLTPVIKELGNKQELLQIHLAIKDNCRINNAQNTCVFRMNGQLLWIAIPKFVLFISLAEHSRGTCLRQFRDWLLNSHCCLTINPLGYEMHFPLSHLSPCTVHCVCLVILVGVASVTYKFMALRILVKRGFVNDRVFSPPSFPISAA